MENLTPPPPLCQPFPICITQRFKQMKENWHKSNSPPSTDSCSIWPLPLHWVGTASESDWEYCWSSHHCSQTAGHCPLDTCPSSWMSSVLGMFSVCPKLFFSVYYFMKKIIKKILHIRNTLAPLSTGILLYIIYNILWVHSTFSCIMVAKLIQHWQFNAFNTNTLHTINNIYFQHVFKNRNTCVPLKLENLSAEIESVVAVWLAAGLEHHLSFFVS